MSLGGSVKPSAGHVTAKRPVRSSRVSGGSVMPWINPPCSTGGLIGPWPHRETRGTSRHWIHLPYLRGRCREQHPAPTPLIHPPYHTGEGAALLLWSWRSKGQRPIPHSCCYHAVLDYEGVRRTILFSGGQLRPPPLVVLNNFDQARSLSYLVLSLWV